MPYEQLRFGQQWQAGQPVLLQTEGHEHTLWVRLVDAAFRPRWLAGGMSRRLVHPRELTTRDPRALWRDPFELQLALALLSAGSNPHCAWLQGPYDNEPELEALHALAVEELDRRPAAPLNEGPRPPEAEPRPRRGWTRTELDAFAALAAEIETVDLAPGR